MMVIFLLILCSEARATEVPAISKKVIGFTPRLKKPRDTRFIRKIVSSDRFIDLATTLRLRVFHVVSLVRLKKLANGNAGQKR